MAGMRKQVISTMLTIRTRNSISVKASRPDLDGGAFMSYLSRRGPAVVKLELKRGCDYNCRCRGASDSKRQGTAALQDAGARIQAERHLARSCIFSIGYP